MWIHNNVEQQFKNSFDLVYFYELTILNLLFILRGHDFLIGSWVYLPISS